MRVYFPTPQVRRATSFVPLATLPGLLTRASLLSGMRVYFPTPQVPRATSLVPLATLSGNLTRASLLYCTASSPSHLARPSCNLAGFANPCEITYLHRKFAEPPLSCLLQPCGQVRRTTSLVPLATSRSPLTRASLLSCIASSLSHLTRASCNLVGFAHPCEFSFLHRKFTEQHRASLATLPGLLTRVSLLSGMRVYFPTPQVRRATSFVPLATWLGLLTRASLLSGMRVYFPTPQVRRATSFVPLATWLGLLTRASLLSCSASSPSHLIRASCNLAGSANPCELTFLHRKFAEPPRSCLLQPCRVC
ncbi:hypothetical protein CRG98_041118 [Punica granatum]|uniref:Uncharacterized protein n=1 Tax=Punica granatum TaxID=22663 RepID=A0A2I0I3F1_PUNGR|nr:hypothetical protein CRG98_041118 [Punica granatum]